MKIGIASDHRGFETKEKMTKYLIEKGYDVIDYGTYSKDRTDYTKYGFILGENVSNKTVMALQYVVVQLVYQLRVTR